MARTEKYFLGPGLLSDIRHALLRVDAIAPSTSGLKSDVLLDRLPERGRSPLQRGTFTHAAWAIGSTMRVTIQGSTNTISVTNYCVPVEGETNATQTQNVVFGRVMGTVTAVEIQQPPVKVFRVATFTDSWNKGSNKTVTFKYQTTTPNTVSATNLLLDIPAACGTTGTETVCLIAKEGTAWYYANHEKACENKFPAKELDSNAECGSSTGQISQGSGVQVLLNDEGCARWWKLDRREFVIDVQWNDGIVVKKKFFWVVLDPEDPTETTIVESVEC